MPFQPESAELAKKAGASYSLTRAEEEQEAGGTWAIQPPAKPTASRSTPSDGRYTRESACSVTLAYDPSRPGDGWRRVVCGGLGCIKRDVVPLGLAHALAHAFTRTFTRGLCSALSGHHG